MATYTTLNPIHQNCDENEFRLNQGYVVTHNQNCSEDFDFGPSECLNNCMFLVGAETPDEEPMILGLGCVAEFVCWGGDPEDVTALVICEACYQKAKPEKDLLEEERFHKEKVEERFYNERLRFYKEYWGRLSFSEFEEACASLLKASGFDCELTQNGADGGIDILLASSRGRGAAQCKYMQVPRKFERFGAQWTSKSLCLEYFSPKTG